MLASNQQIVIPSFGVDSFYLMMVRPNYERLEIRIRIKQGFSAQLVLPTLELQPDDQFETWLETIDLPNPRSFTIIVHYADTCS